MRARSAVGVGWPGGQAVRRGGLGVLAMAPHGNHGEANWLRVPHALGRVEEASSVACLRVSCPGLRFRPLLAAVRQVK